VGPSARLGRAIAVRCVKFGHERQKEKVRRKPVLVQCAFSAARAKYSYVQFLRLKVRGRRKKPLPRKATSILTAADHMQRDGTFYADVGPNYFARHATTTSR
jgi:hypothetical protein